MLSMKVSMELRRVFLAGSCQLEPGVIPAVSSTSHVPITGHIWGFSPWQTPQSGLKIKQHLSSSWGWAGRGSGEGFCVCLGFFASEFALVFLPSPHSGSELLERWCSSCVRQGSSSRHWNVLPQWKRRKRGGRRKKKADFLKACCFFQSSLHFDLHCCNTP